MRDSWDQEAKTLGFPSEAEMLRELYETDQLSLRDMARILGYGVSAIRERLQDLGVQMRARGGPNNVGRTLSHLSDQELAVNGREIAEAHDVSIGTVLMERMRRRKSGS